MALLTLNLQWYNHNSQRAYPLSDRGNRRDITGSIRLPDDFIVGLQLPVHASLNVDPNKFYVQSLLLDGNGYTISIGYDDGTPSPPLAAAVGIPRALHVDFTSYALAGRNEFDDSVGQIVIGSLTNIDKLPPGLYRFTPANTNLETDVIRPMIRGLVGLRVRNGQDLSPAIYGDVELIAGRNMRIVVQDLESPTPQIVFSAIRGEGLNEECICEGGETTGPPIRFINGIPPLSDGNFRLVGDDCLEVSPITNGILLRDLCSAPCCGCRELEAITRQIDRFADGVLTLQNFASTLSGQVTQTSQVLLGSRLGTDGCVDCE